MLGTAHQALRARTYTLVGLWQSLSHPHPFTPLVRRPWPRKIPTLGREVHSHQLSPLKDETKASSQSVQFTPAVSLPEVEVVSGAESQA